MAGTLSATISAVAAAEERDVDFTASGALDVESIVPVIAMSAGMTGSGALSATAAALFDRSAALTGSGALSATGTAKFAYTPALTGVGALAATGTAKFASAGALTGSGTLSATAEIVPGDIEFVGGSANTGSSITSMPGGIAAGDLMFVIAVNTGNSIAPGLPAGWSTITSGVHSGGSSGYHIAGKVAAGGGADTSGTWTSCSGLAISVYRNADTDIPAGQVSTATSSTITYPALTRTVTDGTSWIYRFAAVDANATNVSSQTPPTGYTHRAGTASQCRIIDSNGPVASNPTSQTQSMNNSARWWGFTFELLKKT